VRTLWRIIIVIPFAFIAASIAASMVLVLSVGVEPLASDTGGDFAAKLLVVGLIGAMFVGAVAGIPALVVIVLAEAFSWRSLVLHLLVGAGVGFAVFLARIGNPESSDLTAFGAAGAVAGFVYWLIAGRNAGGGRERRESVPPEPPSEERA
jgi:hypothetical protein